jgi:hypothetical protein
MQRLGLKIQIECNMGQMRDEGMVRTHATRMRSFADMRSASAELVSYSSSSSRWVTLRNKGRRVSFASANLPVFIARRLGEKFCRRLQKLRVSITYLYLADDSVSCGRRICILQPTNIRDHPLQICSASRTHLLLRDSGQN